MLNFVYKRDAQEIPTSKSNFIEKLKGRLKYTHKKAKQVADKQQERHKRLYNQRCREAKLMTKDMVLVRQTA